MGTGKTLVAIRGAIRPVLVLCRRDDFLTWRLELETEGYDCTSEIATADVLFIDESHHIPEPGWGQRWSFVVVAWDLCRNKDVVSWIRGYGFATVCGDEFHQVKRWKAKRTKGAFKAIVDIPYRIPMTGTPITNKAIEDVFTLGLFIDGGATFGDNWFKFMRRYFIQAGGHGWFEKRTSWSIIRDKLATIAIHIHEDDVLDLPPVIRTIRSVPLTGMQVRFYKRVLQEWDLELRNGRIFEMRYTLERIQKLQQIASGWFYDPVHHTVTWLRSRKLELLERMILDDYADHQKMVIWCAYTPEIVRIKSIADAHGIGAVTFYGKRSPEKTQARVDFRDDPAIRLFIGQVDSGVGMNELISADIGIYFSNSVRVVSKEQSMGRIRRIGSEHHRSITYVELVAEGSIDESRLEALQDKRDLGSWLLAKSKHEKITTFLDRKLSRG